MAGDVLRAAKDIDHIDLAGNIDYLAIDFFAENNRGLRVINRHGNNFETCLFEIHRHIDRRLIGLGVGFDAEHRDALGVLDQIANLLMSIEKIVLPAHSESLAEDYAMIDT